MRHMASLSPAFDRVEWRTTGSRKTLAIGIKPDQPACTWELEVTDRNQKRVGAFRIISRWRTALSSAEMSSAARVARELGDQWDPR